MNEKILILIISIALLSGCSPNKNITENTEPDKGNEIEQIEEVDTAIKKEFIIENEGKGMYEPTRFKTQYILKSNRKT